MIISTNYRYVTQSTISKSYLISPFYCCRISRLTNINSKCFTRTTLG
nr:MAG TPA: hypothetical protein [Caudoviricetes sp.]